MDSDTATEYSIPKINMLHNLSGLETRFRRGSGCCAVYDLLHSSLNLLFRQRKLHNIFIFGMAYYLHHIKDSLTFAVNAVLLC